MMRGNKKKKKKNRRRGREKQCLGASGQPVGVWSSAVLRDVSSGAYGTGQVVAAQGRERTAPRST